MPVVYVTVPAISLFLDDGHSLRPPYSKHKGQFYGLLAVRYNNNYYYLQYNYSNRLKSSFECL